MPGDEGKNPTPTTIDGLAAMMTKVLGRLDALDGIKARLTSLESQRAPSSTAPFPYGLPGFGSTMMAGSSSSTAAATSAAPTMSTTAPSLPITCIPFPHSPSPIPDGFTMPSFGASGAQGHGGASERLGVPRFNKIYFPYYDGAEEPLNWLHRCEQFFRSQRTLASDRVWLASYHMTGVAQTWYYALEQDEGMPS